MPAPKKPARPAQRAAQKASAPATRGEAKKGGLADSTQRPPSKPAPRPVVNRPAPRPVVNHPAPRPVVNAPASRPVPGGTRTQSVATVPLNHQPAESADRAAELAALGVAQPGQMDGVPNHEVADRTAVDVIAAQFEANVSARSEVRALSVKGAIWRAFNDIYRHGAVTTHSGRAIQHLNQHIHGYRP